MFYHKSNASSAPLGKLCCLKVHYGLCLFVKCVHLHCVRPLKKSSLPLFLFLFVTSSVLTEVYETKVLIYPDDIFFLVLGYYLKWLDLKFKAKACILCCSFIPHLFLRSLQTCQLTLNCNSLKTLNVIMTTACTNLITLNKMVLV